MLSDRHLALFGRTPAAARTLKYLGEDREGFEAACLARNPKARFADDGPEAQVDALATDDLDAALRDLSVAEALAPGGAFVAVLRPAAPERVRYLLALVQALGIEVLQLQPLAGPEPFFSDIRSNLVPAALAEPPLATEAGLVLVGRKAGGPADPPLLVQFAAFAPRLMDIRTSLPSLALRTDPGLVFACQKIPVSLPPTPPGAPKVIILQRPNDTDTDKLRQLSLACIREGWVIVIEHDDHPSLVAAVGKRPVRDTDWLRFSLVHAVQTSTEQLAEAYRPYNPEVRVFPNAVFELPPLREDKPPRVFYGAVGRGPFAAEVARSLGPVTARRPDAEFEVVGDRAVFDALPTDRKRFHDYLPYADYLRLMGECAVSLSPIEDRPFLDTKSDAKFLDAASAGAVILASPTIYAGAVRHGDTGLIAERLEDWAPLLSMALEDEPMRRRIARQAWGYVRDERMFAYQIEARSAWYHELWRRREELAAALFARDPKLAALVAEAA